MAVAPNLGAPGGPAARGDAWGGRETRPHQPVFFYPFSVCFFFPLLKGISWIFETLSGGHFGEDAIFLCMSCDALSSLDLGHFVPTVHSPTLTHPTPFLWRSSPRPWA